MPARIGHGLPALISSAEGSPGSCPAGCRALPGVYPLTGAAGFGSTSTSTKRQHGHPGLGQLQAASHVSAAAAESPGAPSRPESNHQGEDETPESGGQSTAATSDCEGPAPQPHITSIMILNRVVVQSRSVSYILKRMMSGPRQPPICLQRDTTSELQGPERRAG